jgi:hypothetical protein
MCINDKRGLNSFSRLSSSACKQTQKLQLYPWSLISYSKRDLNISFILSTTVSPQSTTLPYSCILHWTNLWVIAFTALHMSSQLGSCTRNTPTGLSSLYYNCCHPSSLSRVLTKPYLSQKRHVHTFPPSPHCSHTYIKTNITKLRQGNVDCIYT